MVFTVGICDDNPEQVQLLRQYLCGFQGEDEFNIVASTDTGDFLLQLEAKKPHLVFLDIDMGEMNGIRLGESIKALYADTVIVYLTAYEEYSLAAFQVRAFHYLLKPLSKEKFHQVLEEALCLIGKDGGNQRGKQFSVQLKGEIIALDYNDIYYFEKIGRKIKVHTENRDIYYYDNLYHLLATIDADSFIQCHQGYIANVDKIRGLREKTLFLEGGRQLPVSRSYVERVKETLAKRLFVREEKI